MTTVPHHAQDGNSPRKPISEETRAKMAAARRGKPSVRKGTKITEETRAKMKAAKTGHTVSKETRTKLSAAFKGKPTGPRTPEARANMSKAQRGHKHSEAQIEKLKGRKVSEETRARLSEAHKKTWERATDEQRKQWTVNWIDAAKDKKNTSIEQFMASKLDAQGIVYEREKPLGRCYVDFYIPSTNTIIEVQGCYWHGCLQCGYDSEKHKAQREKDAKRFARLQSKGYIVMDVWEHDLRKEM